MHRCFGLPVAALLLFTALLTACSGRATDTPKAATPTIAAPTATPTATASIAATATGPAGSVATGAITAPTTANPTSVVVGTRPAGSATTGSAVAGSTAAAGSTTASAALTPFTDPKGRFSFSRPAAWMVGQSTSTNSVVQFSSTTPLGVVDISTESVASGVTTDTYLDAALAEIKRSIADARQIDTMQVHLDNEPAVQIDYTGTVNGSTIAFSQIFALHKGTAYVLTLGTQPADIARMKQQATPVLQTWTFLQ